jgi:hypothetical protein
VLGAIFPLAEIAPRGFEPLKGKSQLLDNKILTENQNSVLSTSLDKVLQKHPEIASVIQAWPNLPESIKTTIKTLIETAGK